MSLSCLWLQSYSQSPEEICPRLVSDCLVRSRDACQLLHRCRCCCRFCGYCIRCDSKLISKPYHGDDDYGVDDDDDVDAAADDDDDDEHGHCDSGYVHDCDHDDGGDDNGDDVGDFDSW